jgi:protein-S-isoprenylcysteine O-methyltransferase Ste14
MTALKTLIFTIVVPGTLLGIVPWLILQSSGEAVMPSLSIWLIGLLPFLAGIILYFWCAGAFTFIGKGTPAPIDAPVFLVREGPYRWVRNPMYIGVFSVLAGEIILFHSLSLLIYMLLVGVIVHLFVVFYEEPHLTRRFGESYEAYLRIVPRWLPRPPRADMLPSNEQV